MKPLAEPMTGDGCRAVLVDQKAGSNSLLYLPLDKLIQQSAAPAPRRDPGNSDAPVATNASSRRPSMARPTMVSDTPRAYTSAVSKNVTPRSTAARISEMPCCFSTAGGQATAQPAASGAAAASWRVMAPVPAP